MAKETYLDVINTYIVYSEKIMYICQKPNIYTNQGEGRDNSTDSLGSLDQEIRFQKAGALPAKRAPGENQWISLQHHDQYSAQKNGVQFNASGDHKSFVAFQQRNGDQQAIPAEKNEKAESFLRMDVHLKEAPNFSASFRQVNIFYSTNYQHLPSVLETLFEIHMHEMVSTEV